MATVKLELEADLGPMFSAFQQGDASIAQARAGIVALGKDTKAAFNVSSVHADKFSHEIKQGTKEVSDLDKAIKATNDAFSKSAPPKTFEEQQVAITEIKKQLTDLLSFEQKMIAERDKVAPLNIKDQFTQNIDDARVKIQALTKELQALSAVNVTPKINTPVSTAAPRSVAAKSELESLNKVQSSLSVGDPNFEANKIKIEELKKELASLDAQSKRTTVIPKATGGTTAVGEIRRIRREIQQLTGEALKAGHGTEIFTENLRKAGELQNELNSLNAALKSVSGNTTQNLGLALRETTELGVRGFEGLIAAQALFGEENEQIEKQILKLQAVQSISRLISDFGGLKDKLHEIKLAFTPLTNLYTRGNEALKKFGKDGKESTEGLAKSGKGLFSSLSGGIKSFVTAGISGFKSLWATIAANPLGAILVVIGGVITAMVLLKDKIKPIGALFDFLGDAAAALLVPIEKLGQLFGIVATEHEKASKKIIANTEKEIEAIEGHYNHEIALAEASEKRTNFLEDSKLRAVRERVKQTIEQLEFLKKENGKLTEEQIKEFEAAEKKLTEIDRERTLNIVKQQQDRAKAQRSYLNSAKDYQISLIKDDETREKAAAKNKLEIAQEDLKERFAGIADYSNETKFIFNDLSEIEKQRLFESRAVNEEYQKAVAEITKKYAEKRAEETKKNIEKLLALQKDYLDAWLEIEKRVATGELNALTGEARLAKEREISIKEIELLRENLIKKGQLEEDFDAKMQKRKPQVFQLNAIQEEQFNILQRQVFAKETEERIKLAVDRENKLAQARSQLEQSAENNTINEEVNLISTVELQAKPKDMSEVDFELVKQKAILDIQNEFAIKRLEAKKASLAAERDEQIKALNGELELLKNQSGEEVDAKREQVFKTTQLLESKFAIEGEKIQDETAKIINNIQAQRDKLAKVPKFDLAKFLGLTPADMQNIQTIFTEVQKTFDSIFAVQLEQLDQDIQNSERRKSDAENEIKSLEGKLKAEQGLAEQGKANNQSRIQQQITQQEQEVQKEAELGQKAIDEKKKIQKQKLLIDSITQGSNLITASTEILANTARDPISLIIALTAVAAMITGFAVAKQQALKAINSGNDVKFAKGVIDLQGPGTGTSDSINAKLSAGESVMTAKETKQNKKLFKGIRTGNKTDLKHGVLNLIKFTGIKELFNLGELLAGTGVSLPEQLPQRLAEKRDVVRRTELKTFINNDFSALQKEQRETNKRLDQLIDDGNKKPSVYRDANDNIVITKGTHTTRILNKK